MATRQSIMNNNDENDFFEVEGKDYNEAAYNALKELGWTVVVPEIENERDEDIDTIYHNRFT